MKPLVMPELDRLHYDDGRRVVDVVPIAPKIEERDANELPDPDELSRAQFVAAVERLHEDASSYPRFPWSQLATLSGPMCPEDLIIVAARTGGGKSLFLQNLFDSLIVAGHSCLYIGLEQSADVLRNKWACLRAGVSPKLVLAPREHEQGSLEWQLAMDLVQSELKWQRTDAIRRRAHFSKARKINRAKLKAWTRWAVEIGCTVVIVDHVDRVDHGPGQNSFHEISETIRDAKELAASHRIVMILASQIRRPGDALERFMPPALHDMRGAGTKEEEADTVLGIYRPLKPGVSDKELKLVRQGIREPDSIVEQNVMGVMLLKHRLDGPVAGKVVRLSVKHQRVTESTIPAQGALRV